MQGLAVLQKQGLSNAIEKTLNRTEAHSPVDIPLLILLGGHREGFAINISDTQLSQNPFFSVQ